MKIYYLKYYKGNIEIKESYTVRQEDSKPIGFYTNEEEDIFRIEEEAEILEWSMGSFTIWITEKGSLELAYKKLNDYVEKFHHKNIKMYRERIEQEGEYLSAFYEESMDAYLDGIYKYYNIDKKKE